MRRALLASNLPHSGGSFPAVQKNVRINPDWLPVHGLCRCFYRSMEAVYQAFRGPQ